MSVRMPGRSHQGPLDPPSPVELEIRTRAERHVRWLSDSIGSRGSARYDRVQETVGYLIAELGALGHHVEELAYTVEGRGQRNLQVTIPGTTTPGEIVIVGAHYDTHDLTPGADDNATGVAGVLELARLMAGARPARTVRFVLFGTEEPPWFNRPSTSSSRTRGTSSPSSGTRRRAPCCGSRSGGPGRARASRRRGWSRRP